VAVIEDIGNLENGTRVLLPFRLFYARDPLPHTWDATSDSVAGWIAGQLRTNLVIATDVDGIYLANTLISHIKASELDTDTCVDAFLPRLLETYNLDCTIINGNHFRRVIDAIQGRETIGTTIIGRK
jgi:hypothetical protein